MRSHPGVAVRHVDEEECSLIIEAEEAEADVMRRPPRRLDERLFALRTLWLALAQGLGILAAGLVVFRSPETGTLPTLHAS